jgi:hypothetical protein
VLELHHNVERECECVGRDYEALLAVSERRRRREEIRGWSRMGCNSLAVLEARDLRLLAIE